MFDFYERMQRPSCSATASDPDVSVNSKININTGYSDQSGHGSSSRLSCFVVKDMSFAADAREF